MMKWTYEIINEMYICDMEIGCQKNFTHLLMYKVVFHLDYNSHGLLGFCQRVFSLDFVYISIEIVIWLITNHGHFWLGIFDCNQVLESDFYTRLESKIMIDEQVWVGWNIWIHVSNTKYSRALIITPCLITQPRKYCLWF